MSSGVDKSAKPTKRDANGRNLAAAQGVDLNMPVGASETLDVILQKAGRLAPLDALRYLSPLISVLGDLHATKQTHGSLALDLLRVTKGDDNALRLQILKSRKPQPPAPDINPKAALAGRMVLYSSPEQIQGNTPTEFDDMYAVGHIAYTLLVGEPYWADEVDRLGFMTFCKAIMGGLPEAPSVRAMRRHNIRLPCDFDAWFVLITDRKHPDKFGDITDAGIALTSVLSNPDLRELSRSVQFKFNPNLLDMPAVPAPLPEPDNLRVTAVLTIIASISVALAIVFLLRWSNAQPASNGSANQPIPRSTAASSAAGASTSNAR